MEWILLLEENIKLSMCLTIVIKRVAHSVFPVVLLFFYSWSVLFDLILLVTSTILWCPSHYTWPRVQSSQKHLFCQVLSLLILKPFLECSTISFFAVYGNLFCFRQIWQMQIINCRRAYWCWQAGVFFSCCFPAFLLLLVQEGLAWPVFGSRMIS